MAGCTFCGFTISAECEQALIGDFHYTDIGLNGAERIILAAMPAFVRALKRVDLPTLGRPTIPHLRLMAFSMLNGKLAGTKQYEHTNSTTKVRSTVAVGILAAQVREAFGGWIPGQAWNDEIHSISCRINTHRPCSSVLRRWYAASSLLPDNGPLR